MVSSQPLYKVGDPLTTNITVADAITDLGYTAPTSANLMSVPPYACAFAVMFATSWSSDRMKERGIHITVLASIAAVCYLCLAVLPEDKLHAKYGILCIAVSCVYATYPPSHAWAANNFGELATVAHIHGG